MSKFNQTQVSKAATTNLAGGAAFKQTANIELVSLLLTSFVQDEFYRKQSDTINRLKELLKTTDKQFAAKAAVFARHEFGMRSITHVLASELSAYIGGTDWAKSFYDRIVKRPDDMMEILSYHTQAGYKITNAMKKGFGTAIGRYDAYSLAKYRGEGKGFKMVDVVNMCHPKSTERSKEAITKLLKGELKSTDENETWESVSSAVGKFDTDKAKWEYIVDMWTKDGKVKNYFAILRNLRNVIQAGVSPTSLSTLLEALTNEQAIKSSLVLPFRFTTAFTEIEKLGNAPYTREVKIALNKALDLSMSNVPAFTGNTLVVLDESGSMEGRPAQIGSLFSAVLVKACGADLITFSDSARYRNVNPLDSTTTIMAGVRFASGGTNFHSIFTTANKKYDRVVILSDMQGWMGGNKPTAEFNQYRQRFSADPYIYSFDLAGYGTLQFPEANVFCLAGWSDKIFDIMKVMEEDRGALITKVNSVQL